MKKIIVILSLLTFIFRNSVIAQEQDTLFKMVKVGVKGFSGINFKNDLHNLANDWIKNTIGDNVAETSPRINSLLNFIEYGYQPFLIIHPIKWLQVGVKMDCSFSKVKKKVENPIIKEIYEFKTQEKSYIPGMFAYYTHERFEIGGGIINSYTRLKVSDNYFGYYNTWSGQNVGYEASIGFSSGQKKLVGFTMSVRYRYLKINKITDSYDRKITYSDSNENMSLILSGLFINVDIYFQFIDIKKK